MTIEGDQGARDLMAAHPDLIHDIALDAPLPMDVDTDEDVTAMGASG
jgi:CTP:molybdopterin cytidylyltransferase MocA